MMVAGVLGGALALLAAQPAPPVTADRPAALAAEFRFAPPLDRPLTYRVTTRRVGRDGSLLSFSLVYRLRWQQLGRGYRLAAVLQRIDSDASPDVTRALTMLMQPLVGEELAYLVPADGSSVALVDPDGLWERVTGRAEAAGAAAGRPEARQLAQLLAALPPAERDSLATADIRALVAPANEAIPRAAAGASASEGGTLRTIAHVERDSAIVGEQAQPLEVDTMWTIDTATGLIATERRQSWIVEAGGAGRTLVEERIRALEPAAPV